MRSLHNTLPETCARKKAFRTRREANMAMQGLIALRDKDRKGLCVYLCTWDKHFHVGHKPKPWYKDKRN